MKRIFSIYKPYMLHAIFYKGVTRLSVAAAPTREYKNRGRNRLLCLCLRPLAEL